MPAALLDVGEAVEEWEVNDEMTDRIVVSTSVGTMTASKISSGVSLHSVREGSPRETMLQVVRHEAINAAIEAGQRYPVALGLFILLEQADMLNRFLGTVHVQTGGAGLSERLLTNPRIQDVLEEPLREAMSAKPGSRKRKKQPSEHFAVLLEGIRGLAIAHFGEERAMLMPFTGNTDDFFDTIPVIPMDDLLDEEKTFIARVKARK